MKVVFLSGGAREKALEFIVEHGIEVVGVITPFPSEKNNRFSEVICFAKKRKIPVEFVHQQEMYNVIKKFTFDILISCGFIYKIDKEIISLSKYAINVHPTLLPKYRGFRSGPYILINGEKKSGVTIHFLTEEFDKGNIIVQEEFAVSPFDTPKSMMRKSSDIEGRLLLDSIKKLEDENLLGMQQDENEASIYNYRRTPNDSEVDWNLPLKQLYNEIRACDPEQFPAFFYVDGEKVCINMWREKKKYGEDDMI